MLTAQIATGAVAVAAAVLAFVAAVREPAHRRGTATAGLGFLVWGAASVAAIGGLPEIWFWFLLRPLVLILFAVAGSARPAERLTARDYFDILNEGWLTMASVVGCAWIIAYNQTLVPVRED